jgi:winged helix DNA-binding protein
VELARRWLRAFGPAPIDDLKWWTGWTAGQVKKALAGVGPVEVDLDGTPGVILADDVDPVPEPEPVAALLPALDPTPMGWARREWYLGEHRSALFDRTGNIGPSVWWGGRIVGGWAHRPDGEIVYRILQDVGRDAEAAIEAERTRLQGWLGDLRVTPKFRTPLEKQLAT